MAKPGLVVVTGATGRQGSGVARALLAAGWRVRAMTREPKGRKAQTLLDLGAEIVQADMDEPASLDRAFDGAYGVYSVQNPMISGVAGEVWQGRNVGEAAGRAEIQRWPSWS